MSGKSSRLSAAAAFIGLMALTGATSPDPNLVPMTGNPPHRWFDWIFFGIVIPWLLLALWDYIQTSKSK